MSDLGKIIQVRIADLEDKERWMRDPKNPDGHPSAILLGRVQGQISEAKHILLLAQRSGGER